VSLNVGRFAPAVVADGMNMAGPPAASPATITAFTISPAMHLIVWIAAQVGYCRSLTYNNTTCHRRWVTFGSTVAGLDAKVSFYEYAQDCSLAHKQTMTIKVRRRRHKYMRSCIPPLRMAARAGNRFTAVCR